MVWFRSFHKSNIGFEENIGLFRLVDNRALPQFGTLTFKSVTYEKVFI